MAQGVAALCALLVLSATTAHAQNGGSHRFSGPVQTTIHPSPSSSTPSSSHANPSTTTSTSNSSATLVVDEAGASGRFEYIQVISSSTPPASGHEPKRKDADDDVSSAKETTMGPVMKAAMEPVMKAGLQFLSNMYNPHHWAALSNGLPLSQGCRGQLRTYLNALENGTTWAVQSELHYVN